MLDNIPYELRQYNQWVVWTYVDRGGSKPTKVPLNPHNGYEANVNDASTWSSFDHAKQIHESGYGHGIGFVLSDNDPFAFIDLDAPQSQVQQEIVNAVYSQFNTYAEWSPSGTGVHMILYGSVASGKNKRPVELYSRQRFMTVTGNVCRSVPILRADELLLRLWEEMGGAKEYTPVFASEPERMTDEEMYNKAVASKTGELFMRLWSGNWSGNYSSQSDADMALMNILAHYSHNHEQLARMFRMSGLGQRAKAWRETYLFHPSYGLVSRALDRAVKLVPIDGFLASGFAIINAQMQAAQEAEIKRVEAIMQARQQQHEANETRAMKHAPVVAESVTRDSVGSPYEFGQPLGPGEQFDNPPGLLGMLASFIYLQSTYPLPQTALIGALGFMSGLCGRAYNVNGMGVNTYLLLVAPTSAGKEAISSGIGKLAQAIKAHAPSIANTFGHSHFASGQALYREIKAHKSILAIQGEYGKELEIISSPRAPGAVKLLKKAYLELFTKSGKGQFLGKSAFADREKDAEQIESPTFSLIGETAPGPLYDVLTENMISDGFLPRFAIVEVDRPEETFNENAYRVEVPREIVEAIVRIAMDVFKLSANNLVQDVTFDDAAYDMQDAYRKVCRRAIIDATREATRQLWSRAHAKAIKIAALVAIGCTHHAGQQPTITPAILTWAIRLVNDGIHRLDGRFLRGEVGEGDGRAIADMETFITRYARAQASDLPQAKFNAGLHNQGVISYSYLAMNVRNLASVRSGNGGAQATFVRCVIALRDAGLLIEISPEETVKMGFTGKLFKVVL